MKTSGLSEKTIVILCDGDFPSKGPALKILKKACRAKKSNTVIACDGAILSLVENGMDADWITGDMDTLPKKYQQKFCTCLVMNSHTNTYLNVNPIENQHQRTVRF